MTVDLFVAYLHPLCSNRRKNAVGMEVLVTEEAENYWKDDWDENGDYHQLRKRWEHRYLQRVGPLVAGEIDYDPTGCRDA